MKKFDVTPKQVGFSLIELSIVLIIIGLLVAGVTGGRSLIDSARQRALINEIEGWKKATYTFVAATGRLPGDLNSEGYIGRCMGLGCPGVTTSTGVVDKSYPVGSFPAPYNATGIWYTNAPYVDLYLEKIIDFKPAENNGNVAGINKPYSKTYKGSYYDAFFTIQNFAYPAGHFSYNIKPGSVIMTLAPEDIKERKAMIKPFKNLDQKIDDGIFNEGKVRSWCYATGKTSGHVSYDEALEDTSTSGYCYDIRYTIYSL